MRFLRFTIVASFFMFGCLCKKGVHTSEQKIDDEIFNNGNNLYFNADSSYFVFEADVENRKIGLPPKYAVYKSGQNRKFIDIGEKYYFIQWENDSTIRLHTKKGIIDRKGGALDENQQENINEYLLNIYTKKITPIRFEKLHKP